MRSRIVTTSVLVVCAASACPLASAAPTAPVYNVTLTDAVTGPNSFIGADGKRHWTITPGADSYQNDFYERPTAQTFKVNNVGNTIEQRYATDGMYYGYVDIARGRAGFDAQYLYVSIDMWSLDERTDTPGQNITKGLNERYGFRIGKATADPQSRGGMLLVVDQPASKNNPTQYNGDKALGYRDTNNDVGGTGISVTKQDRNAEVNGNGYDLSTISDGKSNGGSGPVVLFSRLNPNDASIVEFAFDYAAFGYTAADLASSSFYLDVEAIKGGPKDPANYIWNDEYTKSEAGSPYRAPGTSVSEFGTQGLGNLYELDTLRFVGGALTPEPTTALVLGIAGVGVARRRR